MNIGGAAFANCSSLTSIAIPEEVTSIGSAAFEGCNSLESIELPEGVTSIEYSTFYNCGSLKSIVIPDGVTNIGEGAFYGCISLVSIELPDGVTDIEMSAFSGCSSLTSVVIPKEMTSIKEFVFVGCSSLTSVVIPEKVTSIGWTTFMDSTNLVIYGYSGSYAEEYAKEFDIPFISICEHGISAYETTTTKATTSKNGSIVTKCSVCGNVSSKTTIYRPKTVTLSATSYTYNGKVKAPKITVKDSNGKTISASNYTVIYSNNKNVGEATATIKFKGNYSGTITKTFKINPVTTSISKLTAKSKGFTAKWTKKTTQVTGYQLQYATSSSFSKAKTVTISKNSTTSKTISSLTKNKKYYVRIRTYKTVNGTKYYSSWSSKKSIKTK